MKFFIAPIAIGTLFLLASAPPTAAQSKPASAQGALVHLVTTRDPPAERESYTQKARDEMQVWQKLQDFNARVQSNATDAQTKSSKDLDNAWTEAKSASDRLETAGEKDWDSAKISFRTASNKLAVSWHEVNPVDK